MATFREITKDEKLCTEAWHQQFATWGSPFDITQWGQLVSGVNGIIAKHGLRVRTFGVVKDEALVAACEVIERRLYIGKGEVATDYGVAAVHTPAEHRKQGYAAMLINGVVSVYKGDLKGQLSLWSDVGDYYARMGFEMLPGDTHLTMAVLAAPRTADEPQLEWIDSAKKLSACQDAHNKQLMNFADATGGQVIEATAAVYDIAVERNVIFKTLQGQPAPKKHGARIGNAWMTWTYKHPQRKIEIMGAEGSAKELAELLRAAADVAAEEGLEKVEVFETTLVEMKLDEISKNLESLGLKTETYNRKNMLPMAIGRKPWIGAGFYAWY